MTGSLNGFLAKNKVELITVGVLCTRCGNTWGIRLRGITDLTQIDLKKLICEDCLQRQMYQAQEELSHQS